MMPFPEVKNVSKKFSIIQPFHCERKYRLVSREGIQSKCRASAYTILHVDNDIEIIFQR